MVETQVDGDGDLRSSAREYAWNWFEFHAKQRQQSFRFYLTLIGALLAAYYIAARLSIILQIRQNDHVPGFDPCPFLISAVAIVVSVLFYRLDRRNRILVKYAEDILRGFELEFAAKLETACAPNFIERGNNPEAYQPGAVPMMTTYGEIYRLIFLFGALVGLLGLIVSRPPDGMAYFVKLLAN
jgi:hypothetical protein